MAFPYFWLLNTEVTVLIWLTIVPSLPVGYAAMYAPQARFLSELFGISVRYCGASIGYQLAPIVGEDVAPFIVTALLAWRVLAGRPVDDRDGLVTVVAVFVAAKTSTIDVYDARPERHAAEEPAR